MGTFQAKRLSRDQVESAYEQLLRNVDGKRLELWAQAQMEAETPVKEKLMREYRTVGAQYDRLAADFADWLAVNPVGEDP